MNNQNIPPLQPPFSDWEKGWYAGRYKRLVSEKEALKNGGGLIPPALNGPGNLDDEYSKGWKIGFNTDFESPQHNLLATNLHQDSV